MRIWDVPVELLCDQHLLSEHAEGHAVWSIYANGKTGYRDHPEVRRWDGHLPYLASRHDDVVAEMERRGMNHDSPLSKCGSFKEAGHLDVHPGHVTPIEEQRRLLAEKDCPCPIEKEVRA